MSIHVSSEDATAIRKLIPFSSLSTARFEALCALLEIEEADNGSLIFEEGDSTNEYIYLLSGKISLKAGDMEMESIVGGSDAARFALAHQIPRKASAVTFEKVRFIRVDAHHLMSEGTQEESPNSREKKFQKKSSGDWMKCLLRLPIFQKLSPATLQNVLMSLEEVEAKAGESIISQGEDVNYFHIISKGRCKLTRKPSENAKEIELGVLKKWDTFGEDALILEEPQHVSITMLSDGALLYLEKNKFLQLIKQPIIEYVHDLDFLDGSSENIIIDVGTSDGFDQKHINGSIHIPFFSLRMHLNNLDRNKKYFVICENGKTSEAAAFLFKRYGYDAVVLEGGFDGIPNEYLEQSSAEVFLQKQDVSRSNCSDLENSLNNQNSKRKETKPSVEKQLGREEADEIISRLEKELDAERQKLGYLQQEANALRIKNLSQSKIHEELKEKIKILEKDYEATKQGVCEAQRISEANAWELTNAKQEEQAIRLEYQLLDTEFKTTKTELNQCQRKNETLEKSVDSLRGEKQEFENKSADFQLRLEENTNSNRSLIVDNKNKLEDSQNRVRTIEDELATNQNQLQKMQTELGITQTNLDQSHEEVDLLKQLLTDSEKEVCNLKTKYQQILGGANAEYNENLHIKSVYRFVQRQTVSTSFAALVIVAVLSGIMLTSDIGRNVLIALLLEEHPVHMKASFNPTSIPYTNKPIQRKQLSAKGTLLPDDYEYESLSPPEEELSFF